MTDVLLASLAQHHRPPPSSRFWFHIVDDDKCPPKVADIKAATIDYYGITVSDMNSYRRDKAGRARLVAMYLSYKLTNHSLSSIARLFNRSDHSVPLHAFKRIRAMILTDPNVAADVVAIEARLS